MSLQADLIRAYRSQPVTEHYGHREVILYALGAGATAASEDLDLVYEKNLKVLPTFAVVIAREAMWLTDPQFGINFAQLLHGEQSLEIHRPLAASARVTGELTVDGLYDKGPGRGALLVMRRSIRDAETGEAIATVRITSFLRADGGFGGEPEPAREAPRQPERAPDVSITKQTTLEQALLYRLSGDYNPIHVDADVAQRAGFPGPILHGLCTYGIACRAVIQGLAHKGPEQLKSFSARFSSPVFPGDAIVTDMWIDGDQVQFQCRVPARNVTVLSRGLATFA